MQYLALAALLIFAIVYFSSCDRRERSQDQMILKPPGISNPKVKTDYSFNPIVTKPSINNEMIRAGNPPSGSLNIQFEMDPINIQKALKNAGYYSGGIDGKIGPKTKEAIREFQRVNNLEIDGVVGPQTWSKLSSYLNDTSLDTQINH